MNIEISRVQRILDWVKTQIYLDASADNARNRVIKRGQVYYCNFGYGIGSEMQKERPAVILQIDAANKRSGNTIVVPITHDEPILPCMAKISDYYDGNGNVVLNGSINTSNIMCVSKARLGDFICNLNSNDLNVLERTVLYSIGLEQTFSKLEFKIEDRNQQVEEMSDYLEKLQEELSTIRFKLGISEGESIIDNIH